MNIDVVKAIKELLFEHDTVILPGLGGFISSPVAAAVDYVQGTVLPPSRKLEFNTNLVINDGVLVNHIQQSNVVTGQESNIAIENYVAGIKEALEAREIVDLPEIGRLYKDYEQKIRFMPDTTNFEADSFGLPTVKFNPIVRQRKTDQPPQTTSKPAPILNNAPGGIKSGSHGSSWAERILPTLIILAAVLLAFSLFMWLKGCGDQPDNVPHERVNVKPNTEIEKGDSEKDDKDVASIEGGKDNSSSAVPDIKEEETKTDGDVTIEKPAPFNIFVVVHSFGSLENAQKFANDLEKAGYIAKRKRKGGLYRVGVEVPSSRNSEIDNLIQELGKKFKSTPVAVDY